MAAKKTDWKRERDKLKQVDPSAQTPFPGEAAGWHDKGKVLLEKGTRQSTNNDVGGKADSMEELMRMWYENQQGRRKNKKRMPFKGLFGGGE